MHGIVQIQKTTGNNNADAYINRKDKKLSTPKF